MLYSGMPFLVRGCLFVPGYSGNGAKPSRKRSFITHQPWPLSSVSLDRWGLEGRIWGERSQQLHKTCIRSLFFQRVEAILGVSWVWFFFFFFVCGASNVQVDTAQMVKARSSQPGRLEQSQNKRWHLHLGQVCQLLVPSESQTEILRKNTKQSS